MSCYLKRSLAAWDTEDFGAVFRDEVAQLEIDELPLQRALAQGSVASKRDLRVMLVRATDLPDCLEIKAGIFYTGILPGCACSDDVAPDAEFPEYCDVLFRIDRATAATAITLL